MQPSKSSATALRKRLLWRPLKVLAWLLAVLVVALAGSYFFAPQWLMQAAVMRQAADAKVERHSVQAGDTRWVYYEGGTGPTIVLLHGFASSKEVWLPVARRLTPQFHVVIPDLPGWGESSRTPGANYDMDAQAARLDTFVQALGLPRFLLVGHSMGGGIAGVYAAEHPGRLTALALVDAGGLKARENGFSRDMLAGRNPFLVSDRDGLARLAALAFDKPTQLPGRFVDVLVERKQRDQAFIERTFDALRPPSQILAVQHRLNQLTMPVLGLWCRDDKIIDASALDSLRDGLPAASAFSSSTLRGCNHMPMLEKPEETAHVLIDFAHSH